MEYTKEIYESEYGYGYKIFIDGKLTIIQPHTPGVSGFRGMTSSEANKYADAVIEQMNAPPKERSENERLAEEMMNVAQRGDDDTFNELRRVEEPRLKANPN